MRQKLCFLAFITIINIFCLDAEITNIQYEGTWARSHYYDWGMDRYEDDLYIGDNTRVEKYHILENGDLEYSSSFEDCSGFICDIHVAGDSLYVMTNLNYESNLYILNISQETPVLTNSFLNIRLGVGNDTFFSNDKYVFLKTFNSTQDYYYYDKSEQTLNTWERDDSIIEISNELRFDIDWDNSQGSGSIKIKDITNLNSMDLLYQSDYNYHPLGTSITTLNDSIVVIINEHNVAIPEMFFWNINNPSSPEEISRITLECDDSYSHTIRPLLVGNFLYVSTHSTTGNRYIYDISDLDNPTLNCSWQENAYNRQIAYKSKSYGNYFYTSMAEAGIAKYNMDNLPITESENNFGECMQSWITPMFDGERVIIYKDDRIFTKEYPDDEENIIYQDPNLKELNGGFTCNDSILLVKVMDQENNSADFRIIETATGEIMNSYYNREFCQNQYYIEPYFYFSFSNKIEVYDIDNEWNLNLVTTLNPPYLSNPYSYYALFEFMDDQLWVNSGTKVLIYDTTDFTIQRQFNNTDLVDGSGLPYLRYFDESGYFVTRNGNSYGAKTFFLAESGQLELIQTINFVDLTNLAKVEDDIVAVRPYGEYGFRDFTGEGISGEYYSYNFKNIGFTVIPDNDNNRIFAWKTRSFESFTYDYFVEADENEVTQPGCSLKNFPNPFNPNTVISFEASDISSQNSDKAASIEIYNIKGQKIKSFKGLQGKKAVVWHGDDESGKAVGSGVYFYQLQRGEEVLASRKMTLMK